MSFKAVLKHLDRISTLARALMGAQFDLTLLIVISLFSVFVVKLVIDILFFGGLKKIKEAIE